MGVAVVADMAKLFLGRADQQGVGGIAASKLGRGREEGVGLRHSDDLAFPLVRALLVGATGFDCYRT
jgi:hypothetical protein